MRITPEQVANLIFSVSQLRYFEKELMTDKNNFELNDIVVKWQYMIDKVLIEMGVEEYISRKQLLETIQLEYNADTDTTKEDTRVEDARKCS
jgi:hypothetical protein